MTYHLRGFCLLVSRYAEQEVGKECFAHLAHYSVGVEEDDKILEDFFNGIDDDTLFQMIIMCDFLEDKNLLKFLCYHVRDKSLLGGRSHLRW